MLFVRNMMFLNSATAVLAPDLDMLQQMMAIYLYFAQTHGDQIMREVGVDASFADARSRGDPRRVPRRVRRRVAHVPRAAAAPRRRAPQAAPPARAAGPARGVARWRRGADRGVAEPRPCPSCRRCRRWPSASTPSCAARSSSAAEPLGFSALKTVVPGPESLVGADRAVGRAPRQVPRVRLRRRRAAAARAPLAGGAPRRRAPAEADPRQGLGRALPLRRPPTATTSRCSSASTGTSARPRGGCSRPATTARSSASGPSPTPTSSPSSCSTATTAAACTPSCATSAPCRASGAGTPTTPSGARSCRRTRRWRRSTTRSERRCSTRCAACSPTASRSSASAPAGLSQPKLGEHFEVHARHGTPCPRCGEAMRRVSYESHEVTYCPTCQTGGKVLADRRMSRLVK